MVTFYEIDETTGGPSKPVLFLDTLKVSTIEQTAEQADARGGKGNPKLITWDYGKEMTVTLEDALFSPKSMALIMGSKSTLSKTANTIDKVAVFTANGTAAPATITLDIPVKDANGVVSAERKKVYIWAGVSSSGSKPAKPGDAVDYDSKMFSVVGLFDEDGTEVKSGGNSIDDMSEVCGATLTAGHKYFLKYRVAVKSTVMEINADVFPGTYYVTGDTYVRSDKTGKDQFFQFIIPKAKMTSEQTITLEAEGDPSTFSMNLTVLRPEDGDMLKLVQYDIDETV